MLKLLMSLFLGLSLAMVCQANEYEDAWKAIRNKKFDEARTLLQKATNDPATALDAYLTLMFLQTYQGNEDHIKGLVDRIISSPDRNAYVYPIWFNGAILGQYSKKKDHQLQLLNRLINEKDFNGTLRAAGHYVKAMHHVFSNEYKKARTEWDLTGAIQDWQLTGPFENLSGSAFNAGYGPINSADPSTKFAAANNIEVNWFTPARNNREGWLFTYPHLPVNSAIIYAQSFVYAPEDMQVMLNAGSNGSLKIWVNDGLILSEAKERVTELDYYKNYCNLKKGYNRILVQLGYTDNSQPNFIIRLTDEQSNTVEGLRATAELQPYPKGAKAKSTHSLKHFAEEYFEKKISTEPRNLINYIMLSQAYLRHERSTEARKAIEKALQLSPDNPLLKFELIQCLIKANNRTLLMQEVEWLKENDPHCYINYQIKIDNLVKEEKYTEAAEELDQMRKRYPEDESMFNLAISIAAKMEKMEELFGLVEKAYKKYPDNTGFLGMKFRIEKLVKKDPRSALGLYEKFFKNNYNFGVLTDLADEYKDQGMNDKYLDILKKLYNDYGYDPDFVSKLATYYYEKQNYSQALEYAREAISLAPYTGSYWSNLASIQEAMKNTEDAIKSYKKTIYYDRTNYEARKKLNLLEQKPDPVKLLPETDVYDLIKKAQINRDHDFTYLLDEKAAIIYEEGASEEYTTYVVKINTKKGIDSWKELYLPYDSYTQTIQVEKSEVVKANGSKHPAERNDNEVVFTGLEEGDALYIKYRTQNYASGRLGRAFFDKYTFSSFVPSGTTRYTLIAPKDYKFNGTVINTELKPVSRDAGEFRVYTWQLNNVAPLRSEPMMPPLNDVAAVLHISSLKDWSDVANWYSDISYKDTSGNFELAAFYNEIFEGAKPASEFEKAKRIYNYMLSNIRYSSVSFRQSGLVPQDISKTISTKLGDCKDLSTLFVALAGRAGIKSRLVLIDTRDNGVKDMVLPTMEFNHCIVMAELDGKEYYIELTDNNLPFASLPKNLNGALALVIPANGQKSDARLQPLVAANRTPDRSVRKIDVTVEGRDIRLKVETKRFGSLTSSWREGYATLPPDKQKEEFEQSISNGYKNPVKLEEVKFEGLTELIDSVVTRYTYTVKNEIIEAGSMKMIKVPFIDLVATLESISAETRQFPIEYWDYENTDVYETVVRIKLPAGQKAIEIPSNQNFRFKDSHYSLKFVQEKDQLVVYRYAKLNRGNIEAADYLAFRKFFNDIVEAESKYIVFK